MFAALLFLVVLLLVFWLQSLSKLNLLGRNRDVGVPRSPRQGETQRALTSVWKSLEACGVLACVQFSWDGRGAHRMGG